MAHSRTRHILPLLEKKLKFSPVVAIQGVRQCGKSFLVRNILTQLHQKLVYLTFDETDSRKFAKKNPDTFLDQYPDAFPLAIDEAQKVPEIFDAVKLEVDEDRKPGRYLLLGSSEFSKLNRIRESLTGRMSRIQLYPFNGAEAFGLSQNSSQHLGLIQKKARIDRKDFLLFLNKGGMPGIFAIRSEEERNSAFEDWLAITTERDAVSFPRISIESDLCKELLKGIAQVEEPSLTQLAKFTGENAKRVSKHLEILTSLFVLHRLQPHRLSTGKPLYFLCDVGLANILGASLKTKLLTWILQEQLSQRSYRQDFQNKLSFYRTTKGSFIHFIVESPTEVCAIKVLDEERVDLRDFQVLQAFQKKLGSMQNIQLACLGPKGHLIELDQNTKIEISPWECMI